MIYATLLHFSLIVYRNSYFFSATEWKIFHLFARPFTIFVFFFAQPIIEICDFFQQPIEKNCQFFWDLWRISRYFSTIIWRNLRIDFAELCKKNYRRKNATLFFIMLGFPILCVILAIPYAIVNPSPHWKLCPSPPPKNILWNGASTSEDGNSSCICSQKYDCLVFNVHYEGFYVKKKRGIFWPNFRSDDKFFLNFRNWIL